MTIRPCRSRKFDFCKVRWYLLLAFSIIQSCEQISVDPHFVEKIHVRRKQLLFRYSDSIRSVACEADNHQRAFSTRIGSGEYQKTSMFNRIDAEIGQPIGPCVDDGVSQIQKINFKQAAAAFELSHANILRLRGGNQTLRINALTLARRAERSQKRKEIRKQIVKKRRPHGPHVEPWRKFRIDEVPDNLEVRKMTSEGHHILRLGQANSRRSMKLKAAQQRRQLRLERGLRRREERIQLAEARLKERKQHPEAQNNTGATVSVKVEERVLMKLKHELIRYKDFMFGTSKWKNMTAHTVPRSLRHIDDYKPNDALLLYKAVKETRAIVFNHNKATTASPQALLKLMKFFGHECMKPQMQRELLRLKAVKTVVYLSLIGGGHVMLRRPSGKNPFGSRKSLGGKRPKDAILAAAGCEMLLGVSRKSPWIMSRMVKLNMIQHLIDLGLLFTRHFAVLDPLLCALTHFARLGGRPMADWKLNALRGPAGDGAGGALELVVKALWRHPLHFRVKRAACECAVALVSGQAKDDMRWRRAARELVKRANITALAEEGLDAANHFVGSRFQARRAVFTLRRRLLGREAVPLAWLKAPVGGLRKLSKAEARELARQGRLPWNAGEVDAAREAAPQHPHAAAQGQAAGAGGGGGKARKRVRPWSFVSPEVHPVIPAPSKP